MIVLRRMKNEFSGLRFEFTPLLIGAVILITAYLLQVSCSCEWEVWHPSLVDALHSLPWESSALCVMPEKWP
jgi:hypothetical protein